MISAVMRENLERARKLAGIFRKLLVCCPLKFTQLLQSADTSSCIIGERSRSLTNQKPDDKGYIGGISGGACERLRKFVEK